MKRFRVVLASGLLAVVAALLPFTSSSGVHPAAEAPPLTGSDRVQAGHPVAGGPNLLTASSAERVPPGRDTTGVPAGQVLRSVGSLWLNVPGQIISNVEVAGCVVVVASNVVIRNSRINCANPSFGRAINVGPTARNLLVEDSEINGMGSTDVAIGWSNYTLRSVEITGSCDGIRADTSVSVFDSWVHDMASRGDFHCDAMQITEGKDIVVRNSLLDPRSSDQAHNAALMIGTETGSRQLTNALFEGNWLGGGQFAVNIRRDAAFSGLELRDNVYSGDSQYGPIIAPPGAQLVNNTLQDGSAWPVVPAR